jgi:hypothetical protein
VSVKTTPAVTRNDIDVRQVADVAPGPVAAAARTDDLFDRAPWLGSDVRQSLHDVLDVLAADRAQLPTT